MKIFILTQYFPPEVGASQTRLYETAKALQRCGQDVEVFTSLPSYRGVRFLMITKAVFLNEKG